MCCLLAPGVALGAPRDHLVELRSAVSVAAEAAAVIDLQRRGQVTRTYAGEMQRNAREELTDLADSTRADAPGIARLIEAGLAALGRGDAAALRLVQAQLAALEAAVAQAD
jgi:hypothetical protein